MGQKSGAFSPGNGFFEPIGGEHTTDGHLAHLGLSLFFKGIPPCLILYNTLFSYGYPDINSSDSLFLQCLSN